MPASRRPRQLELPVPLTWGGRRKGAGRRPGPRPWVPRRRRPPHRRHQPIHVTLHAVDGLRSFRSPRAFAELREAFARSSKPTFRLCAFSVQSNHVHLLVEADSREALIRGVQGLAIRAARAANRALNRKGKVWGDRYHARRLTTPREVRHALVYVLMNHKKHAPDSRGLDPCSSGAWFTGWRERPSAAPPGVRSPVVAPETWLLGAGWKRQGLLRVDERPSTA